MRSEFLRSVPLFQDLPEADLERLAGMLEIVRLAPGEVLFHEGERGDRAYIVESGEVEIVKTSSNRQVLLAVRGAGSLIGEMALLEEFPRNATVRARSEASLLGIPQEDFDRLLRLSPAAARSMLNLVLTRWRATSSALGQSEKMAQLGTLTAGVAHELNNPAAAVQRGASHLADAVDAYAAERAAVARLGLGSEQERMLTGLEQQARLIAGQPSSLTPLERSDREMELEDWLEGHSVPDPWEIAPALVGMGFNLGSWEAFAAAFTPEQIPVVARRICSAFAVFSMLAEISQGAGRISEIVKALKTYTYLDQAPVQEVDIHEGLDNTLLLLRHKLASIQVRREYASNLPRITAFASELNQVWTNLLDNAADALDKTPDPVITIRTSALEQCVRVEIEDNGHGIPEEILPRIFDPFFTTKPPGKGTGLGLEISYQIVVDKHRGDIRAFSQPGKTVFRVDLPTNFEALVQAPAAPSSSPKETFLKELLEKTRTIAVVGISSQPEKPAHYVPAYLQQHGYRILPVNPRLESILGERAYPDLAALPEKVDMVLIFRPPEEALQITRQAIRLGAKAVWMQEGIANEQAAAEACEAGLNVVMDRCIRVAHLQLMNE
jgi:predicted CoA-binding protein/signal transduction histidine kinase